MKHLLIILMIFPALLKAEDRRFGPFCDRPVTKDELIYYLETGNDTARIFNVEPETFKRAIDDALGHTGGVMEAVKRGEIVPASWTYQESRDGLVKISQFDRTGFVGFNWTVTRGPYPNEQVFRIWGKEFLSLECCNPVKDLRPSRQNDVVHRPEYGDAQEIVHASDGQIVIINNNHNTNINRGGTSSPAVSHGYSSQPIYDYYNRPMASRASYGHGRQYYGRQRYGYPRYGGYGGGWHIDGGYHSGDGWYVKGGISQKQRQHPRVEGSRFISTTPSSPGGPLRPPNTGVAQPGVGGPLRPPNTGVTQPGVGGPLRPPNTGVGGGHHSGGPIRPANR